MKTVAMYPTTESAHNPFLGIISDSLRENGYCVVPWWHRRARSCHFVILNWPENLWAADLPAVSIRRLRPTLRRTRLLAWLSFVRIRGARVVWVAHNRFPHGLAGSIESYMARTERLWRTIDGVWHLSQASSNDQAFLHLTGLPTAVIPHPRYAPMPDCHADGPAIGERVALFLGGFDPRKECERAILACTQVQQVRIVVTGCPERNPCLHRMLKHMDVLVGASIDIRPGYLGDKQLGCLLSGNAVLVLTQERQLNSGIVFLGLSNGCPVICPDTATHRELAELYGSGWIRILHDFDDVEAYSRLISAPAPPSLPDLSLNSSSSIGLELRQFLETIA